jgi:hypothetical protein
MNRALERRKAYGHIGELAFEMFCKRNHIWYKQYGISNKEGFDMGDLYFKIPKLIQAAPDYIRIDNKFTFVECKVADKKTGDHVKIKEYDLKYYTQYDSLAEDGGLKFFIHNPRYKESYLVELYYIRQLFEYGDLEYKFYPESHKKFYIVPMDSIRQFGMSV